MQYTDRRDFFIDRLFDEFHLELAPEAELGGTMAFTAYDAAPNEKDKRKRLFSFVPPTSGMFVWVSGRPSTPLWQLLKGRKT